MQPNQQDPSQQPPTPPAQPMPYAVPEYLHLDPVTGQQQRRGLSPKLIIIGILLLLVVIGGFVGYSVWQYNQPQARFYRALENNLKVTYVERQYTAIDKTVSQEKLQVDVKTDFTKSASPASLATLQHEDPGQPGVTPYKADYVMLGDYKYGIIHDGMPKSMKGILVNDQWYRSKNSSPDSIEYRLDQLPAPQVVNASQGLLPMGDFTSAQRSQLMGYIKAHNVYTMTKNEAQSGTSKYTVSFNIDALNNLNKEVASVLGVKQTYIASTAFRSASELTIWVDDKSDRITKTVYAIPSNGDFLFQSTVSYSYPTKLPITAPNNTKDLPLGVQL